MLEPIAIDGLTFSLEKRFLEGQVALSRMDRLSDLVECSDRVIDFELSGTVGNKGEPILVLRVFGKLPLICQCCLRTVEFELDARQSFELRNHIDDALLTQEDLEDDSRDFLSANRSLDVVALIEDEVLLALPLVARHDSCDLPVHGYSTKAASPFGVLLNFKGLSGTTH